jgi:hypothetical protein
VVVVTCTTVVLTCFVMCGCVCGGGGFVMCVSSGNMCTCIYCVLYCLYGIFYCFVYVYIFLLVLSLLPPSDNSIAVSNNSFPPNATTYPYRLRGPPSWLWRSVTDFEVGAPIGRSYFAPMM